MKEEVRNIKFNYEREIRVGSKKCEEPYPLSSVQESRAGLWFGKDTQGAYKMF